MGWGEARVEPVDRRGPSGTPRGWARDKAAMAGPGHVASALNSLYDDRIKPSYGVLRRRICEETKQLLDVEVIQQHVRDLEQQGVVTLEGNRERDPALLLVHRAGDFVDPNQAQDPYGDTVSEFAQYVQDLGDNASWHGGRYGCAKAVRSAPFLAHYSLRDVQHVMQLAISRKILSYTKNRELQAHKGSRVARAGRHPSWAELRTVFIGL